MRTTMGCTVRLSTGSCGEPAVLAFAIGRGQFAAECTEHAHPLAGRTYAYMTSRPDGRGSRVEVWRYRPLDSCEPSFVGTHTKIGSFYGRTEFMALKSAERYALREVGEIRPDPLAKKEEEA